MIKLNFIEALALALGTMAMVTMIVATLPVDNAKTERASARTVVATVESEGASGDDGLVRDRAPREDLRD